jgi:26S proteasome regulatory subunit N10
MSNSPPQAVVFLIDNSAASLDGDFYPNRLDAQKNTIHRLSDYFLSQNAQSQIGLGTMGSTSFGISSCLTSDSHRFVQSLDRITRGGECRLDSAIRCAILSLKMHDSSIVRLRVISFISSQTPLPPAAILDLARIADREKVILDVVAFGDDVNCDVLRNLVSKMPAGSNFVFCPPGGMILSDAVCDSVIGPGLEIGRRLALQVEDDPVLAAAIEVSIADQEEDDLALALAQSREEGFGVDEVGLMSAIQASMEDQERKRKGEEDEGKGEERKEDDREEEQK